MPATTRSTSRSSTAFSQVSNVAGRDVAFVTTHWTAVVKAGADSPHGQAALEKLCQTYWFPLYAYIRRSGHPPEDAKDLTQAFFARLLEHNLIGKANPERGRFRSFLLGSLKHFLAHEWEKSRALKRGGAEKLVPLEFDTAETRFAQPAAAGDSPDRAYDRQWAMALLSTVLSRLRQEYAEAGKAALFDGLKETLSGARSEIPYRDLGKQQAMSEGAVKVAAHRLRRRYRDLLRGEIANTVMEAGDVEAEMRHLFDALS